MSNGPVSTCTSASPAAEYSSTQSSMLSNCNPGHTSPRNSCRASAVGGLRQKNSVASTLPPGLQTRTSSLAARVRSTNFVTASATSAIHAWLYL